jgi:prevent-host-death family protein
LRILYGIVEIVAETFIMRHGIEHSDAARSLSGLPEFSATALATGMGNVTREVMKKGAAVITKHAEPVMVLLSVERYLQLERATAPDLDAWTRQFDDLYARMQSPGIAGKTLDALDLGAGQEEPAQRSADASGA